MGYTFVNATIPFVISVEIECGYVPQTNLTSLPRTLFLDTHCVHCIKTCMPPSSLVVNGVSPCTTNADVYMVVGALHYNMRFGSFLRAQSDTTVATNAVTNLSKIQSICVNNIIAYNCNSTCVDPTCTVCDSYKFVPTFKMFKLYGDVALTGVDLYTDPSSTTLTPEAITALSYPTGCKTIVVSGIMTIVNK